MNEIINSFNGTNILAIGDLMLDQYLYGTVTRISPEAPVPIVNLEKDLCELGGAANAINNINSLGGVVEAVGVIGNGYHIVRLDIIEKMLKHPLTTIGLEKYLQNWRI